MAKPTCYHVTVPYDGDRRGTFDRKDAFQRACSEAQLADLAHEGIDIHEDRLVIAVTTSDKEGLAELVEEHLSVNSGGVTTCTAKITKGAPFVTNV